MSEKESTAAKALEALREKENRLKDELAALGKEREQHKQARLKELVVEAGSVCDRVFQSLHTGAIAKDVDALRQLAQEIQQHDGGRAYQTLIDDAYGAKSPSVNFFGKFVYEPLNNGRGLADILPKCWGHGDNPYRQA